MKPIQLTILFITTFLTTISAQHSSETLLWGGIGSTTLASQCNNGLTNGGVGMGVGIAYQYNLNDQWGVLLGAEYQQYSGSVLTEYSESINYTTAGSIKGNYLPENADDLQYKACFDQLQESQKAHYINIPLLVRYTFSNTTPVYIAGGIKLGIPVGSHATVTADTLTTSGYFSYDNNTYIDLPEYGFGTYVDYTNSSEIELGLNLIFSCELGYRWSLSETIGLYGAIYGDWGIINYIGQDNSDHTLLTYNPEEPSVPSYHSMLSISHSNEGSLSTPLTTPCHTFSGGIKVSISFGQKR